MENVMHFTVRRFIVTVLLPTGLALLLSADKAQAQRGRAVPRSQNSAIAFMRQNGPQGQRNGQIAQNGFGRQNGLQGQRNGQMAQNGFGRQNGPQGQRNGPNGQNGGGPGANGQNGNGGQGGNGQNGNGQNGGGPGANGQNCNGGQGGNGQNGNALNGQGNPIAQNGLQQQNGRIANAQNALQAQRNAALQAQRNAALQQYALLQETLQGYALQQYASEAQRNLALQGQLNALQAYLSGLRQNASLARQNSLSPEGALQEQVNALHQFLEEHDGQLTPSQARRLRQQQTALEKQIREVQRRARS
jgi:hypothetical protein